MGASSLIVVAADAILLLYFLVMVVVVPLFDAQAVLPPTVFPEPVLGLGAWYADRFGDYLVAQKPNFFVGLVWIEVLFQWPLTIANAYGLFAKKPWLSSTCLAYGTSVLTSMAAIMSELIFSGRASDELLKVYYPFVGFALLAMARGLVTVEPTTTGRPYTIKPRKKRS